MGIDVTQHFQNGLDAMWRALTGSKKGQNVTENAIIEVLDAILRNKTAEIAFDNVMLVNNVAAAYSNNHGGFISNNMKVNPLYDLVVGTGNSVRSLMPTATSLINEALAQPNIAGIPISSSKVETNREIEVSESMVIVQSTKNRTYWTDNAVPRLKEWQVEGYLTVMTALDDGCLIKPSLQWQAYYLDVCAKSRRPVLFKTNRGEFVQVQITSFHTVEEASYNNAIQVSMMLKEYNPYTISGDQEENIVAIKTAS